MAPPTPSAASDTACAMRLRVYPKAGQERQLGQWIWAAHRFRNEAVAFVEARRIARADWVRQHPALAQEWIPEELAGSDATHCSRWLTERLVAARTTVRVEGGIAAPKNDLTQAVGTTLRRLSRGERDALPDAWLLTVPRTVLDQVLQDLGKTIARAYADRKKAGPQATGAPAVPTRKGPRLAGFPKFHRWQHPGSVRLQVEASKNTTFRDHWSAGQLFVPGLGLLRFRDSGYVLPETPPKLITLSRDAAGHFHAAFLCVDGENRFKDPGSSRSVKTQDSSRPSLPLDRETGLPACTGVDLGLTSLVVTASGQKIPPNRHLRRYQKRLRFQSQCVARRQKGSNRHKKAVRALGKTHVRIADCREAGLREVAKAIVTPVAVVCQEDLTLGFMLQNRALAKSAHDAGLGRLRQLIELECQKQGKLLLRCGRFDPSTQTCSACGDVNHELKNNLNIRTWACPTCLSVHDRDVNAAVNIRRMALDRAMASDLSSVPENGVGRRPSPRFHPDLDAFMVRGGLASLRELYGFTRESRGGPQGPPSVRSCEARVPPAKPTIGRRERATVG